VAGGGPDASLRKFYEAADSSGNLQHQMLLRLLFYTAVGVNELVNIRIKDVDLKAHKILISRGKGHRARCRGDRGEWGVVW